MVPATDLPEGDPGRNLVFIDDDITRLRAGVKRLNSRHPHREYASPRTRRFISNVLVEEAGDGQPAVTANALVYRFRSGESAHCVGHNGYTLKRVHGGFRIRYRRAVLDQETLSQHGAVSIILENPGNAEALQASAPIAAISGDGSENLRLPVVVKLTRHVGLDPKSKQFASSVCQPDTFSKFAGKNKNGI